MERVENTYFTDSKLLFPIVQNRPRSDTVVRDHSELLQLSPLLGKNSFQLLHIFAKINPLRLPNFEIVLKKFFEDLRTHLNQ